MRPQEEILSIYERLSESELAIVLAIGGTLPQRSKNRRGRMEAAKNSIPQEGRELTAGLQNERLESPCPKMK